MASPTTERPPSEQGVEYLTLDAVKALADQVAELAKRPAYGPAGNWWDVLPKPEPGWNWRDAFAEGQVLQFMLPSRIGSYVAVLRANMLSDRVELSIQINGGWLIWQRALFYNDGGPK